MAEFTVTWRNGSKPTKVRADSWVRMGKWTHFFANRVDGGRQTIARYPSALIDRIEGETTGAPTSRAA